MSGLQWTKTVSFILVTENMGTCGPSIQGASAEGLVLIPWALQLAALVIPSVLHRHNDDSLHTFSSVTGPKEDWEAWA